MSNIGELRTAVEGTLVDTPGDACDGLGDAGPFNSVYLDNASTSHPKPDVIWQVARDFLCHVGASPGRGAYTTARRAAAMVEEARDAVAGVLGVADQSKVAFTQNATEALNVVIKGVLTPGDHVVTTSAEHNSVLRPLHALKTSGVIEYTVVDGAQGLVDADAVAAAVRSDTALVVINHASNVTGAVLPAPDIAKMAHDRGVPVLLDASQTAGFLDIDADHLGYDFVAFTGHKALHGPPGTGGLVVRESKRLRPLMRGGTGSNSRSLWHPETMPTKFEAGTINYLGVIGLGAAVAGLAGTVAELRDRELGLLDKCVAELAAVHGVHVVAVAPDHPRVPIMSFTVDGYFPGEVADLLDRRYGIATRAGLHCAPLMHASLGTAPHGTVRASLGPGNTSGDIDKLASAVREIAAREYQPYRRRTSEPQPVP